MANESSNPRELVDQLRLAGNEHFKEFQSRPWLPATQLKSILNCALDKYNKAESVLFHGTNQMIENYAKKYVAKNKGVVYSRLAVLEEDARIKVSYYHHSVDSFSESLYLASQTYKASDADQDRNLQTELDWISGVVALLRKLSLSFQSFAETLNVKEQLNALELFIHKLDGHRCIKLNEYRENLAQEWMTLAQLRLGQVALDVQNQDFRSALNTLAEMYRPIEEAKKHVSPGHDLLEETRILSLERNNYFSIASSLQAISIGNKYLDKAIDKMAKDESGDKKSNEESKIMGFHALDMFREANVLSKSLDVAIFCQVLLAIGMVWYRVFQSPFRAKKCFKEAMDVAHTIEGNMLTSKWYIELVAIVEEIRNHEITIEEAKWENQRKPFLKELEPELDLLHQKSLNSLNDFVLYLLENHLPLHKEGKNTLKTFQAFKEETDETKDKKLLVKLITYYHPDGISHEKYGLKYVVLCEEISKILTNRYNHMKGVID